MLGCVIGDIVGSVYEFDNVKTKRFPLFVPSSRVTDDSVCVCAVAESLVLRKDPADTLRKWGKKYLPVTGFSKSFTAWLTRQGDAASGHSKGNGAVMKIAPVGFLYRRKDDAFAIADRITALSHDHPESYRAVHAYLDALRGCFEKREPRDILKDIQDCYGYDMTRTPDEIRPLYNKFYYTCPKSVPEAILCALHADSFEDALRNAVSLGGDSDTLACMAGGLAEARFGIPADIRQKAYLLIPVDMRRTLSALYAARYLAERFPRRAEYLFTQRTRE